MIYLRQYNSVHFLERVISSATYLTAGMAGFLWLILAALLKKRPTQFIMYHTFQSIFLYIAYFLFFELYKLVFIIISKIPILNTIMFMFNNVINSPLALLYGLSLLQAFTSAVIIYLAITSFLGQFTYIPWVSDIINSNTGRK